MNVLRRLVNGREIMGRLLGKVGMVLFLLVSHDIRLFLKNTSLSA